MPAMLPATDPEWPWLHIRLWRMLFLLAAIGHCTPSYAQTVGGQFVPNQAAPGAASGLEAYAGTNTVEWAAAVASFSTAFGRKAYAPERVLGPPEAWPQRGESQVAWAPSRESASRNEFLKVDFARAMAVRQVFVAENLNPGAIARIELVDTEGGRHTVYRDDARAVPFYPEARMFRLLLDRPTPYRVVGLKLTLDTRRVEGMVQIDAIGIAEHADPIRPVFPEVDDELFGEAPEHLGIEGRGGVNSTVPDQLPMISPDGRTLYFARKLHPDNVPASDGSAPRDDIWVSRIVAADGGRGEDDRGVGDLGTGGPAPAAQPRDPIGRQSGYRDPIRQQNRNRNPIGHQNPQQPAASNPIAEQTATRGLKPGQWGPPQNVGYPLNNEHHNFVSWISPDGTRMLLPHDYRRAETGSAFRVSMARLRMDGTGWNAPVVQEVENLYNRNAFTCLHMNPEGDVMLLAIEREDSYGGLDLYVSFHQGGKRWSEPQHMGPTVNTAGMEGSVFIAADGRSLYFSSNGRQGYGGYDMYLSRRLDESWTRWSEPINLGARINSEGDDYYYTIPASGEYAYYSSERDSYGGADLYRIRLPQGARPLPVTLLQARILDERSGDPLAARLVRRPYVPAPQQGSEAPRERVVAVEARTRPAVLILPRGRDADAVLIEARDHFPVLLEPERAYPDPVQWMDGGLTQQEYRALLAEPRSLAVPLDLGTVLDVVEPGADSGTDGADGDSPGLNTAADRSDPGMAQEPGEHAAKPDAPADAAAAATAYRSLETDVRMVPLAVGNKVLLEGVFFAANKAFLRKESTAQLDMVAGYLRTHPGLRVEVGGHTNSLPPDVFCEELSTARARRVRDYLIDQGVDKAQLEARGYGKTEPIASNDTLEGRQQNQRVELTILAVGP